MPAPATQCPFNCLCLPVLLEPPFLSNFLPKRPEKLGGGTETCTAWCGLWERFWFFMKAVAEAGTDIPQQERQTQVNGADLPLSCLPHPSSCTAPKRPCAAALTQQPCWLPGPLALTEETGTFALLSSGPLQENGTLASASCQLSPTCEGSNAVRHGGTRQLGQEGAGEQQPITASWCQKVRKGGAVSYQNPCLSSFPPCCSSLCPFLSVPAKLFPFLNSAVPHTLNATPPPTLVTGTDVSSPKSAPPNPTVPRFQKPPLYGRRVPVIQETRSLHHSRLSSSLQLRVQSTEPLCSSCP